MKGNQLPPQKGEGRDTERGWRGKGMDLIDREKALGCFWSYEDGYETNMPAYDRLQALPIVAEVEDCISRQAAIDALGKEGLVTAMVIVDRLPSAHPEREKGTWTNDGSCPFCGFKPWYERDIHTLSFCPNCGADMQERKEDDT